MELRRRESLAQSHSQVAITDVRPSFRRLLLVQYGTDRIRHHGWCKQLLHECATPLTCLAVEDGIVGVPGHINDEHIRGTVFDLRYELHAAYEGHPYVCQQEANPIARRLLRHP